MTDKKTTTDRRQGGDEGTSLPGSCLNETPAFLRYSVLLRLCAPVLLQSGKWRRPAPTRGNSILIVRAQRMFMAMVGRERKNEEEGGGGGKSESPDNVFEVGEERHIYLSHSRFSYEPGVSGDGSCRPQARVVFPVPGRL